MRKASRGIDMHRGAGESTGLRNQREVLSSLQPAPPLPAASIRRMGRGKAIVSHDLGMPH